MAVDDYDPPAFDGKVAAPGQRRQRSVVVPADRLDGCDATKLRDGLGSSHIARMQDEVHAAQSLEESVGKPVQELWAVSVRHDPDARRQAGNTLVYSLA